MKKKFITLALLGLFLGKLVAQDTQFTQFYASPLLLNPALTGVFEGRYRVGAVYRDQWRNALDYPLRTFALNGDFRFNASKNSIHKDAIGIGLQFFNDQVSVFDFNTTQIALSGAYHKSISTDNRQYLSLGFQYGLTQRNLNYGVLNFHDEFDGITGYTLGTGEPLPENNFSYSDLNVGLNYSANLSSGVGIYAGIAMHHVLEPVTSFFKNPDNGGKLYRRYSAQVAANLPINNRVSIIPRLLVASQGPHLGVNTGANLRFTMGEYGGSAFHIGSWVRPVRNNDNFGLDAVVLLAGIEYSNVLLGLSYDMNLKTLSSLGRSQGAFEISIAYLGDYDNEDIICPKF